MDATQNYYELLGVEPDATPATIKSAFKKLALTYHPDIYKGDDAQKRMRVLLQAYKTLSDPITRESYDRSVGLRQSLVGHPIRRDVDIVSPSARRDRYRHYAFPIVELGQMVSFPLGEMSYTLSGQEWLELVRNGLLRGIAPLSGKRAYYCHRCHYRWQAPTKAARQERPRVCPHCDALDWSEFLLLRCVHCRAVFESEQIRYEVGRLEYGKGEVPPYELFPLCPYCGKAHWCPAEEGRVQDLRAQAATRAIIQRCVWIGIGAVVMVVMLVLMLNVFK
jgi:hypothetical protein